ncbi:uncharacterized protein BXZ73DRAFT_89673 [Epithele typhae]|uniref:uncharacterized protein n=1 Tax=Epithele typhae TaxID=378194 RepID=UPI002008A09C|nr:uncharacterized protein BXZ73DRAFT_89673 [Epithele typhae]KAH9934022.1 hypothetical protein BXZ73DRAFT_89673 [Epithele typhae]
MVQFTAALSLSLAALAMQACAIPVFHKRIAQTTADSTTFWEKACLAAGGADKCNPVSVTAFSTLLAAAGNCDQQDSGDAMIDLAKTLNNDADMIKFAQIFVQQPRNTPNALAVPYCQTAPKNPELNGLFQCQFQGANQKSFVGGLALGANGTIPFGHAEALATLGSCAANPSGPIADGTQLTDITQDPGLQNIVSTGSSSSSSASMTSASSTATADDSTSTSSNDDEDDGDCDDEDTTTTVTAAATATTAATSYAASSTAGATSVATTSSAATSTASSTSSSDFKLQNALDAQKLNAQFATLTASSSCTEGQNACVGGGFAQCVGGKFVQEGCAASLQCFALPLVNSAGTSIACTTKADAEARIAAPGATGGITGSD